MRILICDDEPIIREQLEHYLIKFFMHNMLSCPEIALFPDGESLLADTGTKDIVFLDIEMPGMNGISVSRKLKHHNKNILIFIITSYRNYLDDAMRCHVFRYFDKPLNEDRIYRNMQDALQIYSELTAVCTVKTKEGIHTISSKDILFIETEGRKTIVHTIENNYESLQGMNYWLKDLPENSFFRTHKSFLVNFRHIRDFDHTSVYFIGYAGNAYLSKRKYAMFKDSYLLYLESIR